jgi:hypothetical protein
VLPNQNFVISGFERKQKQMKIKKHKQRGDTMPVVEKGKSKQALNKKRPHIDENADDDSESKIEPEWKWIKESVPPCDLGTSCMHSTCFYY